MNNKIMHPLRIFRGIGIVFWMILSACASATEGQNISPDQFVYVTSAIECAPLTVYPENSRYFVDGCGELIYLSGSHTWMNLQDIDDVDPIQEPFDYEAYLNILSENHHNFFRLWYWEEASEVLSTGGNYWFDPLVYQRTGPGNANDGKPKFDLTLFNQAYFDRMRERVIAAGDRGIYVSIMLFNGWSIENKDGIHEPWVGHPLNQANNINGINGDPDQDGRGRETQTLRDPDILALQEAYIRKVIETVNDLDNVLYEISNEGYWESQDWQYYLINYIKDYESGMDKQHPVGMTVEYPNGSNDDLLNSPAEWISPNGNVYDPEVVNGQKVVLGDTDHFCGTCGDVAWVWKSLTRGYNPILMDPFQWFEEGAEADEDPIWGAIRHNLGYAISYTNRMDLSTMTPQSDLCSSEYCLANPASDGTAEFLVFNPQTGGVTVDLSDVNGAILVEWLDPETGQIYLDDPITGGGSHQFSPPFPNESVLYLSQGEPDPTPPTTSTPTSSPMVTLTPAITVTPTPTTTPRPSFKRYCPFVKASEFLTSGK